MLPLNSPQPFSVEIRVFMEPLDFVLLVKPVFAVGSL